jgi:photosystem II stability/assembly factor-like uncharacterized protein
VSNSKSAYIARNEDCPPFKTCCFTIILISLMCLVCPPVSLAAAAPEAVRWTKVNTPTEGEAGDWVLAAGSDIQHLAMSGDGSLYASVSGLEYTLYRSTDGGCRWEHIGDVRNTITGIAVSPHDSDNIYYATASEVYHSINGGRTFTPLPSSPGGTGTGQREISSIDTTWLNGNIIIVGTRDNDSGEFGGVYTLNEADIIPEWVDTNIGSYDVCTVAFSADFPADRRIAAVVTDENDTYFTVKIGATGWDAEIGSARLDAAAVSASIAFPGTGGSDVLPEELTCFIAIDTGSGEGDVYKIDGNRVPGRLLATDLNVGLIYGRADSDMTGLAVYSDESGTILLAGAASDAVTYLSTDEGSTWTRSRKAPTGGGRTGVLLAQDYRTTGKIYAFTSGEGSALSISHDAGATWNQLSLIDTTLETIVDLAPSPDYSRDRTLFMLTFGSGPGTGGLWRSPDGGDTWERTLANQPDDGDILRRVALPPEYGLDCRVVFVAGESRGSPAIWESADDGQSFRRRFPRDPATGEGIAIDIWAVADKTTLYIGSYDGSHGTVYLTNNRGITFSDGIPAGNQPLYSLVLSPDHARDGHILCSNFAGQIYWTDNISNSFRTLPGQTASPPFSGPVDIAFDPAYGTNRTVYAASQAAGGGLYRFVIGTDSEWEAIDGTLPAGAILNGLAIGSDGTCYAVNSAADGGLERSLNPSFTPGPTFETITRGLTSGATLCGLWLASHRIWSADTSGARLMTFYDTLTVPVKAVSPPPGASGTGSLIDHTVRNVSLDWEAMEGATAYQWECRYDDDFSAASGVFGDSTSASSVRLPALEPATTYYWRVRASSPELSPWSEKEAFTTVMDTEGIALRPESPASGATGVPLRPAFQWTAVLGAGSYELLVFTDAEMSDPVIAMTGEYALPGNVWECDVSLDYATTYYWKVRAISESTYSAWSTTGIFTTEEAPATTETPEPPAEGSVAAAPKSPNVVTPLKANPTPTTLVPPSPTQELNGASISSLSQVSGLPAWVVYLIGVLLSIIILALIVILTIVLKIKRIT